MVLDRELRRLLEQAKMPKMETSSMRPTARELLERLVTISQQTCSPSLEGAADMNLSELLVLTGEAAIYQKDFQTAAKSIEWYFSECHVKNQFYCRAQFVQAQCGSYEAQGSTGVVKLKQVLNAVHYILAVIPIVIDSQKRPKYDFLVYNASVTYWQVTRQLMKPSTFQFLVPSLTTIIDALKLIAEPDLAWLLQIQLALVYALVDANQLTSAAKTINDIVDAQITPRLAHPATSSEMSFRALYEEALRVQVHVGSLKDPECQKIVPNVKRLLRSTDKRAALLVKLQCLKSNNLICSLEAAYVELIQETTGFATFTAKTSLDEVKAFVKSLKPRALKAIDADVLVETAIYAAFSNILPLAAACDVVLEHICKKTTSKIRVLYQVLRAILQIVMPLAHPGGKVSSRQQQSWLLAQRVEGMKAFERALVAGKRQQDPQLIESLCIYAWNLSLPLLQPHVRTHLTRVFGLATFNLEKFDSLLLELRARLYLEMAKLEMVSDFFPKASACVCKALDLDYGTIVRTSSDTAMSVELLNAHKDWIARPVDTQLLPIKQQLDLKLGADFSAKALRVLAMFEQAKESKDTHQQRNIIVRCIDAMTKLGDASDSPSASRCIRLWSEISSFVWNTLHDSALALKMTEMVLSTYFPTSEAEESVTATDKSLLKIETDMRLQLVEVLATRLKDQATQAESERRKAILSVERTEESAEKPVNLTAIRTFALGMLSNESSMPSEADAKGAAIEESAMFQQGIQAIKIKILNNLTRASRVATKLGWTFMLENAAICLWNYHFHVIRMLIETNQALVGDVNSFDPQWILPECVSAFEVVYAALEEAAAKVDSDILANVGLGLSSLYEKTGKLDKAQAIADTFLKRKYEDKSSGGSMSVLHLKTFAELKVRLQVAQNVKDITPLDDIAAPIKIVVYLKAMEEMSKQNSLGVAQQLPQYREKVQGYYQKAVEGWHTIAAEIFASFVSNDFKRLLEEEQQMLELYAEIWVRIGRGALRLEHTEYAIECAEQALLVTKASEDKKYKEIVQLLVVGTTWKWLAHAELLCGRAILALAQEKLFTQKLLHLALSHLVQACEYALRSNVSSIIVRSCEVIWNAVIIVMNGDEAEDNNNLDQVVDYLRASLRYLNQVVASFETKITFYGEMVLLTLAVCEKGKKWGDQNEICDFVLRNCRPASSRPSLPSDIIKEIYTSLAISGARIGKPCQAFKTGGNLKQSEQSLVQAQIFKKIAFVSWKDPSSQFKSLSNAYKELDRQAEEQALVLVDFAEWLITNQHPTKNADAHLESAISKLLFCQKQKLQTATQIESTDPLSTSNHSKSSFVYTSLWFAEKQLRIFVMRAMISKNRTDRLKHVRSAIHEVEKAWEYIIDATNEVEFVATYERDTSDLANQIEFNEWKLQKSPKYAKPLSGRDWIDFLTKNENETNRFYIPWARILQSLKVSNVFHITQPVVTLAYLEKLLVLLHEDGLQYTSMVPTFCLYAVLYHAYIPLHSYSVQIWMDLTQFNLMERLNLDRHTVPLQNALGMFQSHGDSLDTELQKAQPFLEVPEGNSGSRKRLILCNSQVDPLIKASQSIRLLLQFGFIRQAKSFFKILQHSISSRSDVSSIIISECEYLSSFIFEIEGQNEQALARVECALGTLQLNVCTFLEWTLRRCKLSPDLDKASSALMDAEKQAAKVINAGLQRPVQTQPYEDTAMSESSDFASVQLMARVKYKQAMILLKKAAASQGSSILIYVQESKQALDKSIEILNYVNGQYQRSQYLLKYATALQSLDSNRSGLDLTTIGLNMTDVLQEALTSQENCPEMQLDYSASPLEVDQNREAIMAPLGIEIALAKLQIARLLIAPELSPGAIKENELTWCRYSEEKNKHNVVEKWLKATESVMKTNLSTDLPRAMTLITSAINMLSGNSILEQQHATAQVLKLQCQRLVLFHGYHRQKSDALRTHLWTRYTSSDARHATWVCCHGSQASIAVVASQSADSQDQRQSPVQDEQESDEKQVDETRMENLLAAHAASLQKHQLIASEKQSIELVRLCSYELIQVLGCRHPFDCAKNVLVHQSVEVIEVATSLFKRCVANSNVQRLHMQRMKKIRKTHTSAEGHSLPFQLSQLYLSEQSESAKRMSLPSHVDKILAALPSSLRLLCLHFSPDRCYVYAAFLGSTESCVAISRMEFTDTHRALLEDLQRRIHVWREKCAEKTLAYEEAHGRDERFEYMLVAGTSLPNIKGEDALEDEFTAIIADTIELFDPLLTHSVMKAELTNNLPGNTLVLLLDQVFACLPMEAIPVFEPADGITREFSIQILHQRLWSMKKQPPKTDEIRVIVDPHEEDGGNSNGHTIASVVKSAAGGWKDAVEHGQIPSATDWQQALLARRGGGLLYVGPNRVLGSSLPLDIAGMNVALTCQVMLLFDHAENIMSARRQSKIDSAKPAWEIEIESDPYARALVFTLSGVNVLTISQWATTFNGNRRLANEFLHNISRGDCVGKALKMAGDTSITPSAPTVAINGVASDSPSDWQDETLHGTLRLKNRFRYNPVVYGIANISLRGSDHV